MEDSINVQTGDGRISFDIGCCSDVTKERRERPFSEAVIERCSVCEERLRIGETAAARPTSSEGLQPVRCTQWSRLVLNHSLLLKRDARHRCVARSTVRSRPLVIVSLLLVLLTAGCESRSVFPRQAVSRTHWQNHQQNQQQVTEAEDDAPVYTVETRLDALVR